VPLYDSGEAGGLLYYVMPFVEGESLRDRLSREHRIPFEEAVALTREVASALAYAHGQGVVHRDIKPENIMLSGGHAVVTDFGIARALRVAAETGQGLTGLGFAIGTPAYMSPEQATASEVDARSDQYSLACVFYEMVSGAAPFAGPTVQAVLTQALTGPRPRLSKVTRATPSEADAPVQRALASDPSARFDSVQEFAAALERAAGGGSGAVAERRLLRRLVVGLPLAVLLLALGWIWFGPRRASPVVAGAESIAVLPFSTAGAGVELLGEGMVDLLSTNLNTVSGIQTVDPRTVLARWKKTGATGGADLATALGVARDVNASAALLGSIVATGSRVRISADLYGQDQKVLAHAQVDGAADSVLALVDDLSLSLVRAIWQSKEPVPSLRVSGLTTTSLAAMSDYLVGEQFYRRSDWDSAAAAFGRAVEQDSTFALAHYRLAMALGWRGGYGTPRARQASDAAFRFASRLQPRERALVSAYRLFSDGKLAAVDSMRKFVATWPDDVEGWYLLGETQYHTVQLTGLDPAELERPFDRVLTLDSTLTPAAIHPLELTLASRDSAGYARYLGVMRRFADPDEYRTYETAGAILWREHLPDSAEAILLRRHFGATMAAYTGLLAGPRMDGRKAYARFDSLSTAIARGDPNMTVQMAASRGLVLDGLGQFARANQLADSLRPTQREQAGAINLEPLLLGIGTPAMDSVLGDRFLAQPVQSPFQAYLQAVVLLYRGDRVKAGKLIDDGLRDSTRLPPVLRGTFRAAHGWRQILAGDTTAGLQAMAAGLEAAGGGSSFLTVPLRLEYAATLASRPQTADQGLQLFRNSFFLDLGIQPITYYARGRAAEAAGRKDEALQAYGQFVRLWSDADSAAQGRVRESREALARLSGEPRQ